MIIETEKSYQYSSGIEHWCEQNSSFDKAVVRIAYWGENQNKTSISKEAFEKAIPSLYNCPIVCNYSREEDSIGAHDVDIVKDEETHQLKMVNITHPVGVIPESANWFWQKVEDKEGIEREYLCAEALIWKRQEAYQHIKENGVTDESMEIRVKEGFSDEEKIFHIEEFEFVAFTLLESAPPCFPDACLEFSLENFKAEYSAMMEDFKREFAQVMPASADDINDEKKGGKETLDISELMIEFGLSDEDIDFETEGMPEEELRARFTEIHEKKNERNEAKFSLTAAQMSDTFYNIFAEKTMETPYGKQMLYYFMDYDFEKKEVYARKVENWGVVGFTFVMNGDCIEVDFEHPKSKKIVYADLDAGEVEPSYIGEKNFIHNEAEKEFATEKQELSELREYKRQMVFEEHEAQVKEVLSRFSDLSGNESFEALKSASENMDVNELEEKCYAIRGRNLSVNFSLNDGTGIRLPVEKTVAQSENEPYGGVFKKYGIGR